MHGEIIVRLPKLPELHAPQLHEKKIKNPRLKKLIINKCGGRILSAFNTNIRNETIGIQSLKINALFARGIEEKKKKIRSVHSKKLPASAGRGGVHYGKTSSMGMIAQSGIKRTRTKKQEHKPYKPTAQMHTLRDLRYIREFGIPD